MAQAEFNWSELDQDSLYLYFYSLSNQIVGKLLTPEKIQKLISRHVKAWLPIKVVSTTTFENRKGYIFMGGCYHSDYDKLSRIAIELNLHYHPRDFVLKITTHRWRKMSQRFAHIIMHELIHMRQFRSRNFKNIPGYQSTAAAKEENKNQTYYGDRDEMGAFSYNIACEMIEKFDYNPANIKKYLDSNAVKRQPNLWWYSYLNSFNWDHNHIIIRRMKKKILRQLDNAYIGKPFKTTNYLTY